MSEEKKLTMNMELGVKLKLLGVDLSAFYKKLTNGYQILVMPSNLDNNVTVSIGEMISDFNEMFGEKLKEDDVTKKLQEDNNFKLSASAPNTTFDYKKIKFCLKMLYLNIKATEEGGNETKKSEYALSLQVITDGVINSNIKIFNVESLSFNIWNTQNNAILERMSLIDPTTI